MFLSSYVFVEPLWVSGMIIAMKLRTTKSIDQYIKMCQDSSWYISRSSYRHTSFVFCGILLLSLFSVNSFLHSARWPFVVGPQDESMVKSGPCVVHSWSLPPPWWVPSSCRSVMLCPPLGDGFPCEISRILTYIASLSFAAACGTPFWRTQLFDRCDTSWGRPFAKPCRRPQLKAATEIVFPYVWNKEDNQWHTLSRRITNGQNVWNHRFLFVDRSVTCDHMTWCIPLMVEVLRGRLKFCVKSVGDSNKSGPSPVRTTNEKHRKVLTTKPGGLALNTCWLMLVMVMVHLEFHKPTSRSPTSIWWFPEMRTPLVIIHFNGMFPYKPTIWGVPPFQETSSFRPRRSVLKGFSASSFHATAACSPVHHGRIADLKPGFQRPGQISKSISVGRKVSNICAINLILPIFGWSNCSQMMSYM